MPRYAIPDRETLLREIGDSHQRCRQYGVNPNETRNSRQRRLTPEELTRRLEQNRDFLNIATAQIAELYQFVAGAGFAVNIADRDGYILHIIGDSPILERLAAGNCCPGFRWTEKDVGTSVISLALARKIPVQINDNEHFCRRGYGHTCSASPVFDPDHQLIGVIAMSGDAEMVHPHTLGMVITAARAIENQLRTMKASEELLLRSNYMNAIIESIDSGVIAADKDGRITQVNNQGRQILKGLDVREGEPLSRLLGTVDDLKKVMLGGSAYADREIFIRANQREVHLMTTAKPIFDADGNVQGIILVFQEINRIRRLVNEMAGSQARFSFEDILGTSPGFQEARNQAMLAAAGISNVLLLGDTGTGKELFAQSIHNQSQRKNHPFVAINCGAIPRELLESELFGYLEGAFTGAKKGGRPGKLELASGGTVFLDEIGDMPLDMQVKLLRVLQTGEVYRIGQHKPISVDLRIIAATHFDLKQEVDRGNFREDLFYRLNVLPIQIPTLRQRPEDIVPLARHFLTRCKRIFQKPNIRFSFDAEQTLLEHHWPGNVRELENVVERAVNLVDGERIVPEFFGISTAPADSPTGKPSPGPRLRLKEVERQTIASMLEEMGFNLSRSARELGISRATLYNKIKKYGLSIARQSV